MTLTLRSFISPAFLAIAVAVTGCSHSGASGPKAAATAVDQKATRDLKIGEPMKLVGSPVPVSEVLTAPEKYAGRAILISGTIDSVCPKKGCWVRLSDPEAKKAGRNLFVKFTCSSDSAYIVPLEANGKSAIIEGEVKVTSITEADARHYAEDAGKSAAEIAKIVGPQKEISVSSPSVRIEM